MTTLTNVLNEIRAEDPAFRAATSAEVRAQFPWHTVAASILRHKAPRGLPLRIAEQIRDQRRAFMALSASDRAAFCVVIAECFEDEDRALIDQVLSGNASAQHLKVLRTLAVVTTRHAWI